MENLQTPQSTITRIFLSKSGIYIIETNRWNKQYAAGQNSDMWRTKNEVVETGVNMKKEDKMWNGQAKNIWRTPQLSAISKIDRQTLFSDQHPFNFCLF